MLLGVEEHDGPRAGDERRAEGVAQVQLALVDGDGDSDDHGEEVTDEVMDSPRSLVVQQAGNRMHVQKGILLWLLREAA